MYFLLLKIVSHIYVDSNIGGIIGTLRKSIVPIVSYPCVVMPDGIININKHRSHYKWTACHILKAVGLDSYTFME